MLLFKIGYICSVAAGCFFPSELSSSVPLHQWYESREACERVIDIEEVAWHALSPHAVFFCEDDRNYVYQRKAE